jgi:hypothetical protein
LVSFFTTAQEHTPLKRRFKRRTVDAISSLVFQPDTNVEQALRVAKRQLDRAVVRPRVSKIVVLFNDNPSTAFSGRFEMPSGTYPQWYRGAVAAYVSGSAFRGLFRLSDGAKITRFDENGKPITVPSTSSLSSLQPRSLPGNLSANGSNIRLLAAKRAQARARLLRRRGYTIYVVGFVHQPPAIAGDRVDPDLLRHIANDEGIADPSEPVGKAVLVDDATRIGDAFTRVAKSILRSARRCPRNRSLGLPVVGHPYLPQACTPGDDVFGPR